MKTLVSLIMLVALSFSAFAASHIELIVKVKERGIGLTEQIAQLETVKPVNPAGLKFLGTKDQQMFAKAKATRAWDAWLTAYSPAVDERKMLIGVYQELLDCSDKRAKQIGVQLAGVFSATKPTIDEPTQNSTNGRFQYTHRVMTITDRKITATGWGSTMTIISRTPDTIVGKYDSGRAKGRTMQIRFATNDKGLFFDPGSDTKGNEITRLKTVVASN